MIAVVKRGSCGGVARGVDRRSLIRSVLDRVFVVMSRRNGADVPTSAERRWRDSP